LKAVAKRHGWTVVFVFEDAGISGKGVRRIARDLKVGVGTVLRLKAAELNRRKIATASGERLRGGLPFEACGGDGS
jgi:hypothetical protein